MPSPATTHLQPASAADAQYEIIDSLELAKRLCLRESWIRDQVRSRAADPLPHLKFGKYVRFQWGSPELLKWLERRVKC